MILFELSRDFLLIFCIRQSVHYINGHRRVIFGQKIAAMNQNALFIVRTGFVTLKRGLKPVSRLAIILKDLAFGQPKSQIQRSQFL